VVVMLAQKDSGLLRLFSKRWTTAVFGKQRTQSFIISLAQEEWQAVDGSRLSKSMHARKSSAKED
jgi:hypothetical protein